MPRAGERVGWALGGSGGYELRRLSLRETARADQGSSSLHEV